MKAGSKCTPSAKVGTKTNACFFISKAGKALAKHVPTDKPNHSNMPNNYRVYH